MVWRWSEQAYNVGTTAALLLFLLMVFSIPPDPKSLSLDLFNADNIFVPILIKPPMEKEEEMPAWLKKRGPEDPGGKGQRHKGDEGKMGKKTSKNKEGIYAIKGPKDNQEQYLAKKLAEENAKRAGILGVLRTAEGSHLASIFGRDTALGSDTANVLGGLVGDQIGEAYGVGGLGLVGTGSGGGGTGEVTLGLSTYGTIGKGGGGGQFAGYGRGAGGLRGHRTVGPTIIVGQATVRGSLDREIIRRIIRRHINEVKFCYESELTKKVDLAGRVSVQFTIAGGGQVIASVLQSSTMGNVRVESCVVQAVRRWEFPKPTGGGIVIVSYPFNFQSNGSGD
jgi:TonB family protein